MYTIEITYAMGGRRVVRTTNTKKVYELLDWCYIGCEDGDVKAVVLSFDGQIVFSARQVKG